MGIVSEDGVLSAIIFKKKNIETSEVKTRLILSPVSEAGVTNVNIVIAKRKKNRRA